MLTHRNFTSPRSRELAGIFDLGPGDGAAVGAAAAPHVRVHLRPPVPLSRGARDRRTSTSSPPNARRRARERPRDRRWSACRRCGSSCTGASRRSCASAARGSSQGVRRRCMAANARAPRRSSGSTSASSLFWPVHRRLGGQLRYPDLGRRRRCRRRCTQGVPRARLRPLRGLRAHRGGAGADGAERRTRRLPGSVGEPLPGHRPAIDEPDASGVGEVLARGPERDGRLLRRPPRRPRRCIDADGWLAHGRPRHASTTRAASRRRPQEGRHHRRRRRERLSRRARGAAIATIELVKELSMVGHPRRARGRRWRCLLVPDYERSRQIAPGGARAASTSTSATSRRGCRFYKRVKVLARRRRRAPEDRDAQGEARAGGGGAAAARGGRAQGRAARARRRCRAPGCVAPRLVADVCAQAARRGHGRERSSRRSGLRLADADGALGAALEAGRRRRARDGEPPPGRDRRGPRARGGHGRASGARRRRAATWSDQRARGDRLPEPLAERSGSALLGAGQRFLYGRCTTRRSAARRSSRRTATSSSLRTTRATSTWDS